MVICSVSKCEKGAKARTFCYMHYQRWRKHGDTETVNMSGQKKGVPHSWSRRGVENRGTLQSTTSPSLRDIAWAAGFLEGEGSFVRCRASRGDISMTVSAVQVNKEPVQRMVNLFGGSLKMYRRKLPNKDIWRWAASGGRGRGITMTVYPFLSAKRQGQARNAL